MTEQRPIVVITGVGRRISIGTEIARQLAADGWDIAFAKHSPERGFVDEFTLELHELGAKTFTSETDLADPSAPESLVQAVTDQLGPVRAMVASHAQSVDSSIHDTSVESFDRHVAINTRANWLLIKAFAQQYSSVPGLGRIVALTSGGDLRDRFDAVVFLTVDPCTRMSRLELRHTVRLGETINPGEVNELAHQEFLAWARGYDDPAFAGRNRSRHEDWLATLSCPVVRLDSVEPVPQLLQKLTG